MAEVSQNLLFIICVTPQGVEFYCRFKPEPIGPKKILVTVCAPYKVIDPSNMCILWVMIH